jgi:C1A family cysteine protease
MSSLHWGPVSAGVLRLRLKRGSLVGLLFALALAACGGGGGGGGSSSAVTPAAETLFVPANAWSGPLPATAQTISADEFRRMHATGELRIMTPASLEAQQAERKAKLEADRAFLESKTDLSPDVSALLAQSRASTELDAAPGVTLTNGRTVGLVGLGSRIEKAADDYRLSHDPANALKAYELSYSMLNDTLKAQLPTPDTLRTATFEQIQTAAQQLDAALGANANLDNTRLDPNVPPPTALNGMNKPTPGNGVDTGGVCAASGYASRYWFPLRGFVSPVKNQGMRGTCWAFAAMAAVESRERVQNNNPADLSEQFFVSKAKIDWYKENFVDGGSAASGLNAAVDRNVILMPESGWTYNAATGRPANAFADGVAGEAASYTGACTGYSGTCSETAHQGQIYCIKVLGIDACGYTSPEYSGGPGGVAPSRVQLLWSNGQSFDLNRYRGLLASGVSLVASFPVYEGFTSAPNGIVADYAMQMKDDKGVLVNGSYGGHLVQIVGFISNEQLSFPGSAPSKIGGGGYFIIRNSWACAGDGGYWYVPADYVSSLFSSLEALTFDARRSAQWDLDQVTPGGASGLAIDPLGTAVADLRVSKDLANRFAVTHPVANYVRLRVSSDREGVLYDGQWLVNPPTGGTLFANSLPVTFQAEGAHTLTITAQYGQQIVSATKDILVLNSPPSMDLETLGTPQQGENYVINAVVTDINEVNPAGICNAMTWTVTAPDTIVSGSGCERVVRFGTTGSREVSISSHDQEGRTGSRVKSFVVQPPPANPYPRITLFGMYSRDSILSGDIFVGCGFNRVTNNAVIDLKETGCRVGLAIPPRYEGRLEVENPSAEALSYDWTFTMNYPNPIFPPLIVERRTTTPNYGPTGVIFGAADTPYACTLDVRVNAPEASRNKVQRVWTGRCIATPEAPR